MNVTHHRLNLLESTGDRFTNRADGLAVDQAISRRFPTVAARVRVQVMLCGI
jgi:hypothetical protein